jgi:hypothetical protein
MLIAADIPTTFDHASLGRLASIAHPMREAGRWRLELFARREYVVASTDVIVGDGGASRAAIDIAATSAQGNCCETNEQRIAPNGMLNLNAGKSSEGGCALLYRQDERDPVWDSRVLEPGDHFACMPLRPGDYLVSNSLNGASASLQVTYPDPRATARGRRLASGPAGMRVGTAITPAALRIDPGQVLVMAIEARAHLTVSLARPDDGPSELAEWRAQRSKEAAAAFFEALRTRARRSR